MAFAIVVVGCLGKAPTETRFLPENNWAALQHQHGIDYGCLPTCGRHSSRLDLRASHAAVSGASHVGLGTDNRTDQTISGSIS
ncbi:hypothetical protein SV7mr_24440 [Stieleria bergensis]|uniref:Uncharacterized protein n=1 Tax=Stieleria bergensis TaxID=2528025 RepID=A0A517SUX7_9BACT|nr:hypothetical protein SV7mr_24440 [Planctomycetes bacterium SV_7m_r]